MWTKVNETGTYRGQCTELCGRDHGFMPVVVEVVEKAEFNQWLAAQVAEQKDAEQLAGANPILEQGLGVGAPKSIVAN
jgi:cytochrome c oxidase subunit 2